MERIEIDQEREERIDDEVVVDANGSEERVMGWYYYLDDNITFPFAARCRNQRSTSPLKVDEKVDVIEMASADDCEREMFVMVAWKKRTLAIPLAQLEPLDVDAQTVEAVGDWQYWVERGYEF